jgi:hypothetical protein
MRWRKIEMQGTAWSIDRRVERRVEEARSIDKSVEAGSRTRSVGKA